MPAWTNPIGKEVIVMTTAMKSAVRWRLLVDKFMTLPELRRRKISDFGRNFQLLLNIYH